MVHMTETIKVEVDDVLAKSFRKKAMEKNGYNKGSVKNALEGLMEEFTRKTSEKPDWSSLRGTLREEYKGLSSVELQHSIWRSCTCKKVSSTIITKRTSRPYRSPSHISVDSNSKIDGMN